MVLTTGATLLLDVELSIEPVEAEVESTGGFEKEPRPGVKPEPDGCKTNWKYE
jgi:hypothetical protein